MDEKLEQAATYYTQSEVKGMIDHDIDTGDMKRAFIAGANWQKEQSPWISVKDRLPKDRGHVFTAGGTRAYNILLYHAGKFYQSLSQGLYDGGITHWMPIPK